MLDRVAHGRRPVVNWLRRLALLVILAGGGFGLAAPAEAQRGDLRSGRLNPFPKNDIYRLHLVGDWFVGGIEGALRSAVRTLPRVQLQPETLALQSLRRSNWDQWVTSIEETAKEVPIDMAVVMFGVSEVGSLFSPGRRRERFGTDAWISQYSTRVDRIMKALKASNGSVYWIGLPIVRRRDHSEAYQIINKVLRERAYANQVSFVDSFSRFQDENGNFNRYGPDLSGANKLMRTRDGIYFTRDGNAKLAYLVTQMIRRDLAIAKSERTIVLAGSEAEQQSIRRPRGADRRRGRQKTGDRTKGNKGGRSTALALGSGFGPVKADDGSAVYQIKTGNKTRQLRFELPRPALSAAIMNLVVRNQSKSRAVRLGDNAVQVVPGGVPLLSTVTPADQTALALQRRRLSPTQSVFFKVWGKGERLDPKPGRADDFEWPRPAPEPVRHVVVRAEPQTKSRKPPRDPSLPPLPVPAPL